MRAVAEDVVDTVDDDVAVGFAGGDAIGGVVFSVFVGVVVCVQCVGVGHVRFSFLVNF